MKINRNNYEAKFLDYHEKNLSPVEVAEVLFFLEENPGLKELFESYEEFCLDNAPVYFPGKEDLKKNYNQVEINTILAAEITKENREQFFIAYAEGILSSAQKDRLNFFLVRHPELKKEFTLFQKCRLTAEPILFEDKESLKTEIITSENKEEYFVRAVENNLSVSGQKQLELFLKQHPECKKEMGLFSKTILAPDKIYFEDKASLKRKKRKPVIVPFFYQRTVYYAAAASFLLLAGLFFIFQNNENNEVYYASRAILFDKIITHVPQSAVGINVPVASEQKSLVRQEPQAPETQTKKDKAETNIPYLANQTPKSSASEVNAEEIQLQPVVSEDPSDEIIIAQNYQQEELLMAKKIETKTNNHSQVTASANEYQTLEQVVNKKVKKILGIKNTNPCGPSDKLEWWDLAIAAKNGIQHLIGAQAVDVIKVCDGADNTEYVFVAGTFTISRSTSK